MVKILKAGKEITEWKERNSPKVCPLCGRDMKTVISRNRVVDHDHATGEVRAVLCRNCNSLEGKIKHLCVRAGNWIRNEDFLKAIIKHWTTEYNTGVYYPGTKVVNGKVVPPPKKKRRRKR